MLWKSNYLPARKHLSYDCAFLISVWLKIDSLAQFAQLLSTVADVKCALAFLAVSMHSQMEAASSRKRPRRATDPAAPDAYGNAGLLCKLECLVNMGLDWREAALVLDAHQLNVERVEAAVKEHCECLNIEVAPAFDLELLLTVSQISVFRDSGRSQNTKS